MDDVSIIIFKKWKKQAKTKVGESQRVQGKDDEVVWACDAKRRALSRKEGGWNGSKRKLLDGVRDDTREMVVSGEQVYGRGTWRRISSYIEPILKCD